MDTLFKALGEENRLRIINLLFDTELCVCEIESILGLTQTNVSRHLGKLKTEKIVTSFKDAQWTYYKINSDFVKNNEALIDYLKNNFRDNQIYINDKLKYKKLQNSGFSCKTAKDFTT